MGYFNIDLFDKIDHCEFDGDIYLSVWNNEYNKKQSIEFNLKNTNKIVFNYNNPIYIKEKDYYNKDHIFHLLRLNLLVQTEELLPFLKRNPSDMYITLSLYKDNEKLIEWFIPIYNSILYQSHDFDLEIIKDKIYFNKIVFNVLKHENIKITLGKILILDNNIQHNLLISVAELFHLKIKKPLTTIDGHFNLGSDFIKVKSITDIKYGTPLLIENELYLVKNNPNNKDKKIYFLNQFSGEKIIKDYSDGTLINFAIPCVYRELTNVDSSFPVFYLNCGIPIVDESKSITNYRYDSFIKDEQCKMAYRKSLDVIKIPLEIHIYSYDSDTAIDMYNFCRKIIDNQTYFDICGEYVEYEIISVQQNDFEIDTAENGPHYSILLDVYMYNNIYDRNYINFPVYKQKNIEVGNFIKM